MTRIEPISSNVRSVEFDPQSNTMVVEYSSGTYRYEGVFPEHFETIQLADQSGESVGRVVSSIVRSGGFDYTRLEPKDEK